MERECRSACMLGDSGRRSPGRRSCGRARDSIMPAAPAPTPGFALLFRHAAHAQLVFMMFQLQLQLPTCVHVRVHVI